MPSTDAETYARLGGKLDLGDLAGFSLSLFVVEFFDGVSRTIGAAFDSFVLAPIHAVTDGLVRLIDLIFGTPPEQISLAAEQTASAVSAQPLIGFVIAVGFTLVVAWVLNKGVDLVG